MAITLEAIRAAGGIVHSDGNIFFRDISMLQGLAGAAPAAVAPQGECPPLPGAAVWSVAGKDGMPTLGKGWMFSPVQQGNATLPLFTAWQMWAYHDLGRQSAPAAPALEAPAAPEQAAQVSRQPDYPEGHVLRNWAQGWNECAAYVERAALAAAPQAPADLQAAPVAWMYQRHGSDFGAWFMAAGQEADDLRIGRPNIMAPCPNHYGWVALYAAPQAPAAPSEIDAREQVTRALGLGADGLIPFAWSYLIGQIEQLVECESELCALKAAPAAPAVDARDTARMNWLEAQVVNVRAPLRYGSRDMFWASPEEVDGGPDGPSDLRARIDAAQAAAKGENGNG